MHHPLTDIQADFEINRPVRYQITAKRNYFHGRTDGQTSRTTTIGSFFEKKLLKMAANLRQILNFKHIVQKEFELFLKKIECADNPCMHK